MWLLENQRNGTGMSLFFHLCHDKRHTEVFCLDAYILILSMHLCNEKNTLSL